VEFGFTRPRISRNINAGGTVQLTDPQSLDFNVRYQTDKRNNQGMGGLNLPERAFENSNDSRRVRLRHLWFLTGRTVQDISFNWNREHENRTPSTAATTINVLGAFGSGGNPQKRVEDRVNQSLRALWIRSGSTWTTRTGGTWDYDSTSQLSEDNYLGTFEFPSLDAYAAKTPTLYKVTGGNPGIQLGQHEIALFQQNDYRASSRLTLSFGLRYEVQTNLDDYNNFDPRVAAAYALDRSTVVRAGAGGFHMRIPDWVARELRLLDGQRQYQTIISNPSYPDPFADGDGTTAPLSSRRVRAEDLEAPYRMNASVAIERSLPANLFVTASWDYQRALHILRSRDVNAPLPGAPMGPDNQRLRPDPSQGSVWRTESTGAAKWKAFGVSLRQRFSIFVINARYSWQSDTNDTDGEPFNLPSDSYNLRNDLGTWSRRQFNMSVNSRLPFGIYLTTNLTFNSGDAYSVTTGIDDNGDGIINDRPAGGRRNGHIGPGFRNVGLTISKSFQIGSDGNGYSTRSLNFSASMDNALNMTNLSNPVSALSSNSFGKSLDAGDPREIEASLRFQF
jgi:hypothetical protein